MKTNNMLQFVFLDIKANMRFIDWNDQKYEKFNLFFAAKQKQTTCNIWIPRNLGEEQGLWHVVSSIFMALKVAPKARLFSFPPILWNT